MADEKDPQHNPDSSSNNSANSSATPSSNQNLILGIVMGAVVLLLLLLVINQQINKGGESDEDKKLAELERKRAESKSSLESLQYSTGVDNLKSAEVLVEAIKRDSQALAQLVDASTANAAKLRASDSALLAADRQIRELQGQLAQSRNATSRVTTLEAEIADLRSRLAGAVDKLTADALRDDLARLKQERDKLLTDIAQLRADAANMIDRNQYALLKADSDALRIENDQFRAELQRLRAQLDASKLFVTSDKLSPKASKLYRELERLEGNNRAGLEQAYVRIEKDFNARVVESARFNTGSSDLGREHETHLKNATLQSPGNSFFLVVGYASKTGDSKQNETLSSKRATRVASVVNYLKQQGQEVQAVYLGETDRFDTLPEPNQVCEVWEIRP